MTDKDYTVRQEQVARFAKAIDIMKNHIRHHLYPQKIAENEEETN